MHGPQGGTVVAMSLKRSNKLPTTEKGWAEGLPHQDEQGLLLGLKRKV